MHVQNIFTQCTQQMYLMKLLKHQGMPVQQLSVITHALCYCFTHIYDLPSWGGFLSVYLKLKSMPSSSALGDLVT